MMNETLTEQLAIVDYVPPVANAAGTVNSLGVDMSKFKRARFLIPIGAITGAGTLDANLQSSANANFNVVANITNSNITQVTNAAPNTVQSMEVRADQVTQQSAGARYVRARVVTATNTIVYGIMALGGEPHQRPGSQFNLNSTYLGTGVVVNT